MFSGHNHLHFKFKLPRLAIALINNKPKNFFIQIRFGEQLQGKSELSEGLPGIAQIYINAHKLSIKKSPVNYNCNTFLNLNHEIDNEIKICWPSCKNPYYMIVSIVEPMQIKDMIKHIQFKNKLGSLTLNTKSKAMEFLKSSSKKFDTEMSAPTTCMLDLLCPIIKTKMKLPTRSINCNHLQSFDLEALLFLNKINPAWKCPICYIPILVDELVIDSFLLDIINDSSLPENCFKIILYHDGNFKPYIEPILKDDQKESDNEHSENITFTVNLGNSNDENICDEKKCITKNHDSKPMITYQSTNDTDIREKPSSKISNTDANE